VEVTVSDDAADDFPAAHSMDTMWFAIDNDGHVAMFKSGEAGAVPEDAHLGDDDYNLYDAILSLPVTGFRIDPLGQRRLHGPDHIVIGDTIAPTRAFYMFVSDLVPTQDLLARLDAEDIDATLGRAVRVRARDRAAFAELHARDACLGCFWDFGGARREEIAAHGVYRYEHTCENWIAGPYARAVVPTQPLAIDHVPQLVRDGAIAFDGRFSETRHLQPAEHWLCRSHDPAWLALDGRTARPFSGREDGWEDFAQAHGGELQLVDEPLVLAPAKPRWWK
jgi:hypothetical protein